MKKSGKKNGGRREGAGRKPKIIDWATIDRLLMIACTGEEISSYIGVDYDTLQRRCVKEYKCEFAEYIKNGINKSFKISLRRAQWRSALGQYDNDGNCIEKPNISMQIWLGKQILNQSDKSNLDFTDNTPVIQVTEEQKKAIAKL